MPVAAGAIESCTLVASGGTHAICSVSPTSAASSVPTLVHACSRTRLVSSLALGPLLPDVAAVGGSSLGLRISLRIVANSPTCPLVRIEAHSASSDAKLVASANIFWDDRTEQLVAHPAIQVQDLLYLRILECMFVRCWFVICRILVRLQSSTFRFSLLRVAYSYTGVYLCLTFRVPWPPAFQWTTSCR